MAKVAVGQICSTSSMAHNLEQCVKLIKQAAEQGAKILFLPEASDYIATSPAESLSLARPIASSPFVLGLQAAAKTHNLAINVGVHDPVPSTSTPTSPPSTTPPPPSRLYNRTIHILPTGALHPPGTYTKLHLFDFPAAALLESAHTAPGAALTPPFATPAGRLGSLVCFDVRFAEPALALAQPGPRSAWRGAPAQILTYPSAFTVPTGAAHWEVLLRARAVEGQVWVVAAAQVGRHHGGKGKGKGGRVSYGRSMVVDPWGRVVCALPAAGEDGEVEEGAVGALGVVEVDLGVWEEVRGRMPLMRRW